MVGALYLSRACSKKRQRGAFRRDDLREIPRALLAWTSLPEILVLVMLVSLIAELSVDDFLMCFISQVGLLVLWLGVQARSAVSLFALVKNDINFRSISEKQSTGGVKAVFLMTYFLNYRFFMSFFAKWSTDPKHFSRIVEHSDIEDQSRGSSIRGNGGNSNSLT